MHCASTCSSTCGGLLSQALSYRTWASTCTFAHSNTAHVFAHLCSCALALLLTYILAHFTCILEQVLVQALAQAHALCKFLLNHLRNSAWASTNIKTMFIGSTFRVSLNYKCFFNRKCSTWKCDSTCPSKQVLAQVSKCALAVLHKYLRTCAYLSKYFVCTCASTCILAHSRTCARICILVHLCNWASTCALAYWICLAGHVASKAYDRSHRKTCIITGRPLTAFKW